MGKSPTFGKSYSRRNILPRFIGKIPVLVNPTELKIFYQDLLAKALLLINPAELKIFVPLYSSKNSCLLKDYLTLRARGF